MIEIENAPAAIASLLTRLQADGFVLASQEGSGTVNRYMEFVLGALRIRVVADRAQWWIEAGSPDTDWFDADVWQACLDRRVIAFEPSPLDLQAEFMANRWKELVTHQLSSADCLRRTRARRARERLGLPPVVDGEMS